MMTPSMLTKSNLCPNLSGLPWECLLYHLSEVAFIYQAGWEVCLEMIPKGDNLKLSELRCLEQNERNPAIGKGKGDNLDKLVVFLAA